MKNVGKLAVLGAVLAASASFAYGDVINLASFGLVGTTGLTNPTVANGQVNLAGSATCTTSPSCVPGAFVASGAESFDLANVTPTWGPALDSSNWVGPTATSGPSGTINPPFGFYTFTSVVNITNGETYIGIINAMADDTTEVDLTNSGGTVVLIAAGALLGDGHCAGGVPNCLLAASKALTLLPGINTLTFIVQQAGTGPSGGTGASGTDPMGLDFSGTLTGTPITTPTPEPSSLVLLGSGLISAAGMMFRRRRVTA
jgi:PEP-CTERM motif